MEPLSFELFYSGRMQALAVTEEREPLLPPVNEAPQQRLSVASVAEAAREGASMRQIALRHGVSRGTLASFMHRNGLRLRDMREGRP